MAKTFDATLNRLIDEHPADWAAFLAARVGAPPGPARVLESDLSATLQSDRLFCIDGPEGTEPVGIHLELEGSGRLGIPGELLHYNVAAWAATMLPILSVLVLLRPKATGSDLTGAFEIAWGQYPPHITFRYHVIRIWEESVETLLAAGPGLAPLAMLTNEAAAGLDQAFNRFRERLRQPDVPSNVTSTLLGQTFFLCGLRYNAAQIENLYRTLNMTLEDSTTYQLVLQRGETRGEARGEARGQVVQTHRILLALGRKRFGPVPETTEAALQAITDRERLERMAERIFDASGWDDLLATL